ncbi:MAG: zinc ribbon domain-containing protein [Legionella sp.]|nr:zinc ribbon domain-containing protein [Legionella sp.]
MPIYEYHCEFCNHEFEVMQKIKAIPVKICPKCSHESVKRLVSAAGFQLKGTGWYVTDFKNKDQSKQQNAAQETKKTTDTNAPTGKAKEASTETKQSVKKESTGPTKTEN